MGIFLMQWDTSQCLSKFEEISSKIFRVEGENVSWSQKLQRLVRVCLRDHRYDLSPIERAFVPTTGVAATMFNPLRSDLKIAVTATSVRANRPCVISNYNGGPRSDDSSKSKPSIIFSRALKYGLQIIVTYELLGGAMIFVSVTRKCLPLWAAHIYLI
jgi:hypothetical protein